MVTFAGEELGLPTLALPNSSNGYLLAWRRAAAMRNEIVVRCVPCLSVLRSEALRIKPNRAFLGAVKQLSLDNLSSIPKGCA